MSADDTLIVFAKAELEQFGSIRCETAAEILSREAVPDGLIDLLNRWVESNNGERFMIAAQFAVKCVAKFGVGHSVVVRALDANIAFDSFNRSQLAATMALLSRPDDLRWAHKLMISRLREDVPYNAFLEAHQDFLFAELLQDVLTYLLVPDRGPGSYCVDSLFLVAQHSCNPSPAIARISHWISSDLFSGFSSRHEGTESAQLLYRKVNRILSETASWHPARELAEIANRHVWSLLERPETRRSGLAHFFSMAIEEYIGLDSFMRLGGDRIKRFDQESQFAVAMIQSMAPQERLQLFKYFE